MNMHTNQPTRTAAIPTSHGWGMRYLSIVAMAGALMLAVPVDGRSQPAPSGSIPGITVYKARGCGCCTKWVEHLRRHGLQVSVLEVDRGMQPVRDEVGVPGTVASCHTAKAGRYWIEGHVPADLVKRLLRTRPDHVRGIAVPGMVAGSPGMEAPDPKWYQVFSVDDRGAVGVYATRQGQAAE